MTLPFEWPPSVNPFFLFGLLLIVGVLAGTVAHRLRYIPRITGFILVGLLLGPSVSGLVSSEMLAQSRVFVDIALGLILFDLGLLLDIQHLRRDVRLLGVSLVESLASFLAIFLALIQFHVAPINAALAAALGISASPAVLLLVVRELGSSGPVTERALKLVALNNVISFLAFICLLPVLHYVQSASVFTMVLEPLYVLFGSLLLAAALAGLLIATGRFVLRGGEGANDRFPVLIGFIGLAVGAAKMLEVSELMTLLAFGIMTRTFDRQGKVSKTEFGPGAELFFVILFVVAGANLHLAELLHVGWAAVAFVVARCVAKWLAVSGMGPVTGITHRQAGALGLTMVPMAGLAIGLAQTIQHTYPQFGATLGAIVLAAIAILETIGPIATEAALKLAKEVDQDRKVEH